MENDVLYIVMPLYNEEENIASVVPAWCEVAEKAGENARLLVVNDGSKDNSSQILHTLEKIHPQLLAIDKPNSGHGSTCLFAYRKALEAKADYVFQTDSDGQTKPAEFFQFWENRHNFDFIFGNRFDRKDGTGRIIVTSILKILVRFIFGVWVKDANVPFRLMKAESLREILKFIPAGFFLSNVAISAIAAKQKKRIQWYPITFEQRKAGVNSINLRKILKIGLKAISDFRLINSKLN